MPDSYSTSENLPALLGGQPIRPQGPPEWPFDDPGVTEALQRALAERTWGKYHGPHCEQLSTALAEYHACRHVQLCASGTVAVELALRGLKIGNGDEVILAAYDFKGNYQDVLTVGAKPVLVDVAAENWNFDPETIESALSAQTKAILVSHLHGGIVPMPRVMEIARANGLAVIEDACQMPGAKVFGRMAGTWGDVGVLSFGGSKLLTAGRGGAMLTDNEQILQRAKLYSHRGNEAYPLSELQAAVLIPQLNQLDTMNRRRTENVERLLGLLTSEEGLLPFKNEPSDSQPGFYKLGFQYDPAHFHGLPRDDFAAAMRAEGVAFDAGFRAFDQIHSARRYRKSGELSNAGAADRRSLILHHPVLLGEANDIHQITQALDKTHQYATIKRK